MTDYSGKGITGKTIIAYILFIFDVVFFFWGGCCVAESHARHAEKQPKVPDGMLLTLSKDVDSIVYFDVSYDDKVHVKAGAVVLPGYMHGNDIGFYYSETGKDLSRLKGVAFSEWYDRKEELGLLELSASIDCFEEKEQLEAINKEAEETTKAMQASEFKESFTPWIIQGVCLLVIGLFLTQLFSLMNWYALLYVADVLGFWIIFFHVSSLWCH